VIFRQRLPGEIAESGRILAGGKPLFTLRRCNGGWAFADDLQPSLLILGAVIMNLFGEVRDKAARRHRHRAFRSGQQLETSVGAVAASDVLDEYSCVSHPTI
jgi:hypothetical protein